MLISAEPHSQVLHRRAPDACAAIDLAAAFGPLSAVHAALDAAGHGRPCAMAAWFPACGRDQLHAAIAAAQRRFPIVSRRLRWRHGRAVLEHDDAPTSPALYSEAAEILRFSAADGQLWRFGLREDAGGTWFFAGWAHAAADGMSMLRFLGAMTASLTGRDAPIQPRAPRTCAHPARFAAWLPGFALSHLRRYLKPAPAAPGEHGANWLIVPPETAERLLRAAGDAGVGFASWLAAATALAVRRRLGDRQPGSVHLNVPIWRDEAPGGFGFGVGSLLLGVRVRGGDVVATLAPRLGRRLRKAIDNGWDRNLQRFLGDDPRRHARFARLEASPRLSKSISVSWKGRIDGLGGSGGPQHIACFSTTPTLHVSGHVDANGLSLSLTSAHAASLRRALLRDIAEHLGAGRVDRLYDLATLGHL